MRLWELEHRLAHLESKKMHYFNVIGFLTDEELHQVWDICANAMERKGWDVDNSELSIRAFDDNLRQNVDSDTVCEPEPCGTTHPYYYEY